MGGDVSNRETPNNIETIVLGIGGVLRTKTLNYTMLRVRMTTHSAGCAQHSALLFVSRQHCSQVL